jgi:hypothetical protein
MISFVASLNFYGQQALLLPTIFANKVFNTRNDWLNRLIRQKIEAYDSNFLYNLGSEI